MSGVKNCWGPSGMVREGPKSPMEKCAVDLDPFNSIIQLRVRVSIDGGVTGLLLSQETSNTSRPVYNTVGIVENRLILLFSGCVRVITY